MGIASSPIATPTVGGCSTCCLATCEAARSSRLAVFTTVFAMAAWPAATGIPASAHRGTTFSWIPSARGAAASTSWNCLPRRKADMSFSVLMSVYKAERPEYLRLALESLVTQTLQPGELVLVEDGPLPGELHATIDAFRAQLNIRSVRLAQNVGLARALNAGLEHCSHELVARMDSDDISLPDRFEKQVTFMNEHPEIAASSAALDEFDETGTVFSSRVLPLTHEELVAFAKRRSPLSHAVAI